MASARAEAGLRLADLEFVGCSIGYLSHLEHGKRVPSLQVVRELAVRLGVSEEWLATGVDGAVGQLALLPELVEAEAALRFGDLATAGALYERAESRVRTSGERARVRAGIGQLRLEEGDSRAAVAAFEGALALDGGLRSDAGFVEALGRAYARVGEMEMALAVFAERLDAATVAADPIAAARFSVLAANTLIDMGNLARAAEVLAGVLCGSADEDPLMLARLYWSQSRLHAMRDDSASASRYARKALDILEATDYLQQRSRAHHLLAYIEIGAGNPAQALELIARGRELAGCGGTAFDRAKFDIEEARAYALLGELDRAADLAMRASQVLDGNHPNDVGRCYAEIAAICDRRGDLARARELSELALELLEGQAPSSVLADALVAYADLAERMGDRDTAFEAYKRAATTRAELERLSLHATTD